MLQLWKKTQFLSLKQKQKINTKVQPPSLKNKTKPHTHTTHKNKNIKHTKTTYKIPYRLSRLFCNYFNGGTTFISYLEGKSIRKSNTLL